MNLENVIAFALVIVFIYNQIYYNSLAYAKYSANQNQLMVHKSFLKLRKSMENSFLNYAEKTLLNTLIMIIFCFSFQQQCLKRLDNKNYEQKIKRRSINSYFEIITSDECFQKVFHEIDEGEEEAAKNQNTHSEWRIWSKRKILLILEKDLSFASS